LISVCGTGIASQSSVTGVGGIVHSPTGPVHVVDRGKGLASLFDMCGVPAGCLPALLERAKVRSLVVSRYDTYEAQTLGPN
jgi:hypothetical protein